MFGKSIAHTWYWQCGKNVKTSTFPHFLSKNIEIAILPWNKGEKLVEKFLKKGIYKSKGLWYDMDKWEEKTHGGVIWIIRQT